MANPFLEVWFRVPPGSNILADLTLTGAEAIKSGGGSTWIAFNVASDGYMAVYNEFNPGRVLSGFGRARLAPTARQRSIELKLREGRYVYYLALERIAQISAYSASINSAAQLVVMRDFMRPEYDDVVQALGNDPVTAPFTDRVGFILPNSLNTSGMFGFCGPADLRTVSEISLKFVEVRPS